LLGAQDRQRAQQAAKEPTLKGQARALQEIWMAETKKDAHAAFDVFIEIWGVKYDKAVARLIRDREAQLTFYEFPAEHWKHLRTTNVIESAFATVRHPLSNKTALAMIFKLAEATDKSCALFDGHNQLPKLILGVKFTDVSRSSDRKLKPLPPDLFRHQHLAIALDSDANKVGGTAFL
jgi:hypothetical protein